MAWSFISQWPQVVVLIASPRRDVRRMRIKLQHSAQSPKKSKTELGLVANSSLTLLYFNIKRHHGFQ